jgi:hypothetical protein
MGPFTSGPTVMRTSSNSTPGKTGDRILRSQPAAALTTFCRPWRRTITRALVSSSTRRERLVSRPVAMRWRTTTVGLGSSFDGRNHAAAHP